MKLSEVLHNFSNHYEDRNAVAFTLGLRTRRSVGEEIWAALVEHPTARLLLTQADFGPVRVRKKRILSAQAIQRKIARKQARTARDLFWRSELASARPGKFLSILEQEKARDTSPAGTKVETWIYVEYQGLRLSLGPFEWVAGDSRPYMRFTKAKRH